MTGQVCGCVFSPVFLAVLFLLVFFLKFRYEHGGETVKVKDGAKSKFKKNHVAFSSSQRPDRRNGAGVTITKRTSLTWETRGRVTTHTGAPSQPLCACPRDPPPPATSGQHIFQSNTRQWSYFSTEEAVLNPPLWSELCIDGLDTEQADFPESSDF